MVGKQGDGLFIPKKELWKLIDVCGLAMSRIKELEQQGVTAFEEIKRFICEIEEKIEEVRK